MPGFLPHRVPSALCQLPLTLGCRSTRDSGQDRSRAGQMWGYLGSIEDEWAFLFSK